MAFACREFILVYETVTMQRLYFRIADQGIDFVCPVFLLHRVIISFGFKPFDVILPICSFWLPWRTPQALQLGILHIIFTLYDFFDVKYFDHIFRLFYTYVNINGSDCARFFRNF